MRACVYARAYRRDKSHNRTSIERQVEHCLALGRRHNLLIEQRHVFRDMDHSGSWPPTCWSTEDEDEVRPALSAMIEAIETGKTGAIVVFRADRLATASDLLCGLLELLDARDVKIVVAPEAVADSADRDPTDVFAMSFLRSRMVTDVGEERQQNEKARAQKLDELNRLRAKVARLEAELADMA